MEWKEVTLGEIAIFKTGKLNSNAAISNGEYPFFTCSPETLRINSYAFDQEAILLAGNNAEGNFSIKYYKGKFNAYQRTYVITPIRGKVDIKFLYYALSLCLKQLKNMSQGTSTKFLTVTILNSFSVKLPSISDQRRIASILSSLDRKIELNNKINADLEEMAQTIFKNWFVDFEPFKDGKFVDSELGMIPEGWKVGTLGDITKNKSAKVKERNDVKVLSPVTTGELVLSEEYFTKQVFSSSIAKYKIVNKGDFAYNPARVNIGSLGRNEFDFDGCVSPVYVVFSVLDGYENYFDLFRKTDFFKDSVASLAIGGVRQSLSYDDLSSIEVIIPSENAVEEFNNLYNQMKKTIKANKLENSRLSTLRDTLLPRLMSGELEVPE
ncbi:restriction endonuclease subunit S [Prevotella copri]|uniref:restriction endonuclease subunit S n=1 Tax=Segatella copri TaxID=165179 RepID=UPI001C38069C|nr:restriction endonuclease subunit S [Segatella copri]MBV3402569.1 restriction endonuclease subunit S [Segatella copri]